MPGDPPAPGSPYGDRTTVCALDIDDDALILRISGTVPNQSVAMSYRRPFSVGPFSYPYPDTANPQYVVVNCWVEE